MSRSLGEMKEQFQIGLIIVLLELVIAEAYTTFTVGGDSGWTLPSAANGNLNYTAWASNLTFSLGDSLAFHYDNTHTVVQTSNVTTYQSCDGTADGDESLQIWSSPDATAATVSLNKTGDFYFFSSADDGADCRAGMRFAIHVPYGKGLPISPSAAPAPKNGGDDDDGDDGNFPDFNSLTPPPPPPAPVNAADSSDAAHIPKKMRSCRLIIFLLLLLLLDAQARFV